MSDVCECGGEFISRVDNLPGDVRETATICERCGCGVTWRRRRLLTRPKLEPLPDMAGKLCDAASYADACRHALLAAGRGCEDPAKLVVVESIRADLAGLTKRIAGMLTTGRP